MDKIDHTVKRETGYIALWVLIFSVIMEAVFLVIGQWDYTVLTGNLLSGALAVLNFFLMGLTVQSAVNKEEKDAKNTMKLSQSLRTLFMFAVLAVGVLLPYFNVIATIVPMFFPRIAMIFRSRFNKN